MDEGREEPSVKCLEQSGVGVLANVYLKPLSCDVNSLCGLVLLQPRRL